MNNQFPDFSTETTLIVIEQKGSDPVECRERFLAGCEVYKHITNDFHGMAHLLIVGGANNGNSPETIRSWCPADLLDVLVIDNSAGNTHEKGDSILEFLDSHNITSVVQVTSLYHSLRAILTTLQSIRKRFPNIPFNNFVCDSKDIQTIKFAVLDEILLAKSINGDVRFKVDSGLKTYVGLAQSLEPDAGLEKYIQKRCGEAQRIVDYSELGKSHLTTDKRATEIIESYITI